MSVVLSTRGLTKNYGRILAVNNLSLEVPEGSIYGILGPNGSGKTTTLAILLGVIHAAKGTYQWLGNDDNEANRKKIGAVLETPNFYHYLSGYNNLKIPALIKGVGHQEIDAALKMTGLYERKNSKFKTYSLGMKQRLSIASALLGNPKILVLDEPTNGLDPSGIAEIRNLIKEIANTGKTVILASHLLDEVEKVCTHVAILKQGNLLTAGHVSEILSGETFYELAADDLAGLTTALQAHPAIVNVSTEGEKLIATFKEDIKVADLNKYLFEKGIALSQLNKKQKSLEAEFLDLIK